jgi:hypothetical protein
MHCIPPLEESSGGLFIGGVSGPIIMSERLLTVLFILSTRSHGCYSHFTLFN